MPDKLNRNEKTVVRDYHDQQYRDKTVRPEMVEVHLSVCWYTVDEQPSWYASFNARKSRVKDNGVYNGKPQTMYETTNGSLPKLEELWANNWWLKYAGEKMPKFDRKITGSAVVRTDTVYDYPQELIDKLKEYRNDPRMKRFLCGTGKFWVESRNQHREREDEIQVDPFPDKEEISEATMFFETVEEAKAWVEEVFAPIKGLTPEQVKANNEKRDSFQKEEVEEEPEMPVMDRLGNLIEVIKKQADHFCNNRIQLDWIMWRFANIFYAARHTKQGYDDSIGYFLDYLDSDKGITKKQADAIRLASGSMYRMAEYGYVSSAFLRGTPIFNLDEIHELENNPIPEVTVLLSKRNKTFDELVKLHQMLYRKQNELGAELFLTYYGGYKEENGFLVEEKIDEIHPFFVHGWKEVPKEIMFELNRILLDPVIVECQNKGKEEWIKDQLFYYQKRWIDRLPKESREIAMKFDIDQWQKFEDDFMDMALEEESKKKKPEFKLILGINPHILKVTKKWDQSYVDAAIDIATKALASKSTSEKDREKMQKVLDRLK